ncbi:MAG: hypothetical protein HZB38_01775 [Planctomycetes bacterium]|nr:hypothetical protein [Planctomycetota bacterium]
MPGVIRREIPLQTRSLSLSAVEEKAEAILERARKQAVEEAAVTRRQAEAVIAEHRAAERKLGFEEGRRAGLDQARTEAAKIVEQERQQARADLDALTQSLRASIERIEADRHRLQADAETGLVRLALAIAQRVCGLIAAKSSAAEAEVRRLLDLVRHQQDVELHVHPSEQGTLEAVVREFLESVQRGQHVSIVPDPEVSRGGVVLVAGEAVIDATIET